MNYLAYGSNSDSRRRLSEEVEIVQDMDKITQLLKMTNSIRVTFIPSGQANLDKKTAVWSI